MGSPEGTVSWSATFRIGSGFLADSYLHADPPAVEELENVRSHVDGTFEGLAPPPASEACRGSIRPRWSGSGCSPAESST